MKQFIKVMGMFFLFIFLFHTTTVNAAVQSGYVSLKNRKDVNQKDSLNMTQTVTYSINLAGATSVTSTYNGNAIPINNSKKDMTMNSKGWILYHLPSAGGNVNLGNKKVGVVYHDGAFDANGTSMMLK